jgi:glycogen synthase
VLATLGPSPSPAQREEAARSAVAALHSDDGLLEWMEEPWEDLERSGRWLLDLHDELRPDVVHLNGYAHAVLPWHAPLLVVGHSCVLSWFSAVKGHEPPAQWDRYAAAVRAGLARADLVVAPTRSMLRQLERRYALACEREVIPNGRRPSGVDRPKEPFVFAAGRLWDEAKNLATLDRVAPRLPWPVFAAGPLDPGGRPEHIRELGALSRSDTDEWLARATIFALPARYEPFGLAALEAALAGCALVLGDIPSLREVWEDTALFVDPDDDDALTAAVTLLVEEPQLRSALAERATRRARDFTPARMGAAYAAAYRRLANPTRVDVERRVA